MKDATGGFSRRNLLITFIYRHVFVLGVQLFCLYSFLIICWILVDLDFHETYKYYSGLQVDSHVDGLEIS